MSFLDLCPANVPPKGPMLFRNPIRNISVFCSFACLVAVGCGANVQNSNRPGPVDADAPTEFTETESGLKYRILRKSDGRKPTPESRVLVHYSGWLDDTTEFDSSYANGEPASLRLQQVITGWQEGLQLIGEGGMIELEVPPELGYGDRRQSALIGPGATLHFKVELIEVQ